MPDPLKIACIGEAMIELSFDGPTALVNFAGDTLNTAIYLRRSLGPEHAVSYVTTLGVDSFSDRLLNFILAENVSVDTISRHPTLLPGLYAIDTNPDGERSFLYWRENSAARSMFADGFKALDPFDVIYFSAITLAILPVGIRAAFLNWLGTCNKTVVFDSNYRPKLWHDVASAQAAVKAAWQLTDIGLPSVDDEMALFSESTEQEVITRLNNWGVTCGALKRGPDGPLPLDTDLVISNAYQKATVVVDTTAAGDSFNGAFLGSYLQSGNVEKALKMGHECALKVIGTRGAILKQTAQD